MTQITPIRKSKVAYPKEEVMNEEQVAKAIEFINSNPRQPVGKMVWKGTINK